MADDIPNSVLRVPVDIASEGDPSGSERLETDPVVSTSRAASRCDGPAPPAAQSGKKPSNPPEDVARGPKNPKKSSTADHPKTRRDKGHTHVTHHGLLSRDVVRALVRSGENLRTLRRHEKQFRTLFKPRGTLWEFFFDRWWSCILRLHRVAILEAKLLTSGHSRRDPPMLSELREADLPTLVSVDPNELEIDIETEFSQGLFRDLALAQRYDAHYSREANRMLALLLLMRKGGMAALEKYIADGFDFTKILRGGI